MKNFTHPALRPWLRLFLKVIICTLWLLCIVSAAISRDLPLPHLGQNPGDQTVCAGSNPTFTIGTVTVTSGTTTIQWEVSDNSGSSYSAVSNGVSYSGGTTYDLTYPAATFSMNGYLYRYIETIKATACSATSIAVDTLRVLSKPVFPIDLTAATICPGGDTSFTANPTGAAAMVYQW